MIKVKISKGTGVVTHIDHVGKETVVTGLKMKACAKEIKAQIQKLKLKVK